MEWGWDDRTSLAAVIAAITLLFLALGRPRLFARAPYILAGIVTLAFIASARPRLGQEAVEDWVQPATWFVFDVSRSMKTADVSPNRLAHAVALGRDFVAQLADGPVGVIAYSGSAAVISPLTLDHTFVHQAMESLTTSSAPPGGSHLQSAFDALTQQRVKGGLVVIFTDGGHGRESIREIADAADPLDSTVVLVGVGDPSNFSPIPDGDAWLKERDEVVRTRLDSEFLSQLADQMKGIYIPAGIGTLDTPSIMAGVIEPEMKTRSGRHRPVERFQWPLLVAIAGVCVLTAQGRTAVFATRRSR